MFHANMVLNQIPSEYTPITKVWPSSRYSDSVEKSLNKLIADGLVDIKSNGRSTYIKKAN